MHLICFYICSILDLFSLIITIDIVIILKCVDKLPGDEFEKNLKLI